MKKTKKAPYVSRLLLLIFALILFAGAAGLKTVWLRQQVALTAGNIRMLELRINDVERSLAKVEAEIAAALNPMFLRRQAKQLELSLYRPEEQQVVRMRENPDSLQQFAGRSGAPFEEEAGASSGRVTSQSLEGESP